MAEAAALLSGNLLPMHIVTQRAAEVQCPPRVSRREARRRACPLGANRTFAILEALWCKSYLQTGVVRS